MFSGDGHFSSVTSFLKNFYRKEVVIYGINNCFSYQLRETASRFYILPDERDVHNSCYKLIFDYLKQSQQPTFAEAVTYVTKNNKQAQKQKVAEAIKKLMEDDYISERTLYFKEKNGKQTKKLCLFVDWDKVQIYIDKLES